MACTESSPENQFTFEPPKKRRKHNHDDEQPRITKETLLKALADIEDEIGVLKYGNLGKRLNYLRGQVEGVLERHDDDIKSLHAEIDNLKEQVEMMKAKNDELSNENEKLMNKLTVAQATWVWEAHLARFVVEPGQPIYQFARFNQMKRYLKKVKAKDDLWKKIQNDIGRWTGRHWKMVNTVRKERNGIAHPDFIDLDLLESELTKMTPEYHEPMRNMLEILKTTANLMKFGRLAKFYERNKHLFPSLKLRDTGEKALKCIISWDRDFEDIEGLQNIEHEEAKKYLDKYVNNPRTINHYFFIVDSIKQANSKRLGKLARELAERYPGRMTQEEKEALHILQKLVIKGERNVTVLDPTIAKLHIPDFLPKRLWKHGIKIVDKY